MLRSTFPPWAFRTQNPKMFREELEDMEKVHHFVGNESFACRSRRNHQRQKQRSGDNVRPFSNFRELCPVGFFSLRSARSRWVRSELLLFRSQSPATLQGSAVHLPVDSSSPRLSI